MRAKVAMAAVRQKRSKLAPTSCHSRFDDCRRDDGRRCGGFLHRVALLRGFSTPSLQAQGEQRLPSYFNIDRDIPFANADQPATQTLARCNLRVQVTGQRKASNLPLA
jgi:hypothetical protein